MSVNSEIQRISSAVADAYDAVDDMGGTLPSSQVVANLADAIKTIPQGGGSAITVTEEEDVHGGTIKHITAVDLSADTVTADHLETGYTAHDRFGNPVAGRMSPGGGGGITPAKKKQVNFIDYDGTILYSYTATEANALTALPSNPSHTGLTSQGWNWTLQQIKAQLTAMPNGDVWVGQMYVTASGDTEIDVKFLDSARLSPYLRCAVNGSITINWGDNSTDTVTGTSTSTGINTQHVYASTGEYTITIHVNSGSFAFYGTNAYSFLNNGKSTANQNRVYSNCIQAIRVGNDAKIGAYAFANCFSLESVTMPNGITNISNNAFYGCYSLTSATIPGTVTTISTYVFQDCYSLISVSLPSGLTSMGNYMFTSCRSLASVMIPSDVTSIGTDVFDACHSLASVAIPNGVTSIGAQAFYTCYSLPSVTIPASVTSLGNNVFYYCQGIAEYHIKPTTPPTLGTTVFNGIVSDCVIYVPQNSLTTYQNDSAWSAYSSYLRGE